jgi:tetratricopeptide (TPR) repeat protein
MAATKKITRKEIKQPDEFLTLSSRAIEFAQAHTREIISGVGLAIVLGLLIWAGTVYWNKKEAQAADLVVQAQSLLHPMPKETAEGQAVSEEAQADPEAAAKALVLLKDVVENYKRTDACGVARILLGQRYYQSGDYDSAIDTYKGLLKKRNRRPELTAMAREGLAYSYEAKEDFSQALNCYEELSRASVGDVQGWACMGMARCYEKLGEFQKAIDTYRTFLTDHPQHPKAAEAAASIARITQSLEDEHH